MNTLIPKKKKKNSNLKAFWHNSASLNLHMQNFQIHKITFYLITFFVKFYLTVLFHYSTFLVLPSNCSFSDFSAFFPSNHLRSVNTSLNLSKSNWNDKTTKFRKPALLSESNFYNLCQIKFVSTNFNRIAKVVLLHVISDYKFSQVSATCEGFFNRKHEHVAGI